MVEGYNSADATLLDHEGFLVEASSDEFTNVR
jgi:hypothetical protein